MVKLGTAAAGFLCLFSLFLSLPAFATGWIIEEVDPDFPALKTTYLLDEAKVRVVGLVEGLDFVIDLESGKGYIIDVKAGLYAGGEIEEIRTALHESVADFGGAAEEGRLAAVMPDMRVERLPEEESLAGFRTENYRVYLGDLLVEELWLAPEVNPRTEGPGGDLFTILDALTGGGSADMDFPDEYEQNPVYKELLLSGFPFKRISHYLGVTSAVEVRKARQHALEENLFAVPPGFRQRDYPTLFFGRK